MLQPVRVTVDDTANTLGLRVMPEAPVEIESVGGRVELNPGAGGRAGVNHRPLIEFVGIAFQQQASAEVS